MWAELGGLQQSQARALATQYQQAQQAAQLADPSAPFQPSGLLAQAVGTNPAYSGASQQASALTSKLYGEATTKLSDSVTSYQTAAKLKPRSSTAQQQLALAGENAGNLQVAIAAWKRYLQLAPNSPQRGLIEKRVHQLQKSLAATAAAKSSQPSYSTHP